jgi:type IV secretion system protein VirD4
MQDARRLFPGPDPAFGGIGGGEAYRVDQDAVAAIAFDPADRRSWGKAQNLIKH